MVQQSESKLDNSPSAKQRIGNGFLHQQSLPAVLATGREARADAKHAAKPVKAKPVLLPKSISAGDAFGLILMQCRWHIAANIPAVLIARDPEGVHQLRVSLRRLRIALTSFGHDFRTPGVESVRLRAKTVSEELAPARDLDVFLNELLEPAARANGAAEAFEVLRSRARLARQTACQHAIDQLQAPGFAGLLRDLTRIIDQSIWPVLPARRKTARRPNAFDAPVKAISDRMLKHRFEQAKKRARGLERLSDSERHKLRIALKKMRYTAEFFACLYRKKDVSKFLKRLERMQDILGALNDVVTARSILDRLIAEGGGGPLASQANLSFAAGVLYGWQLRRGERIWGDAVDCWKKFNKTAPFWSG